GAIEVLTRALGFSLRFRVPPAGPPQYAEVAVGPDGVVRLGSTRAPSPHGALRNPRDAGSWSQACYVYVDDVDAHHARAVQEGIAVLDPVQDMFSGDRIYTARDPEGHFWTFATRVREVDPS